MKNTFHILSLSAWVPGFEKTRDFISWLHDPWPLTNDSPAPCSFLDPALRRRCYKPTRAALEVAHHCLKDAEISKNIRSVFATRYGESETTLKLLQALAKNKPVSPMGFSLSVHNTPAGYFSIANQNPAPSTTVSQGEDTFQAGLWEACGWAKREAAKPVLLVIADEKLNPLYQASPQPAAAEEQFHYGLALLIQKQPGLGALAFNLDISSSQRSTTLPPALTFIKDLMETTFPSGPSILRMPYA